MTPGCGLRIPVSFRLELASFDVAGVLLNVGVPFLGKVIQREDRRNWADWHARAAVNALDRVNEKLVNLFEPRTTVVVLCVFFRMDAVHWAGVHTSRILCSDTRLCNDEGHGAILLSTSNGSTYSLLVLRRSRLEFCTFGWVGRGSHPRPIRRLRCMFGAESDFRLFAKERQAIPLG